MRKLFLLALLIAGFYIINAFDIPKKVIVKKQNSQIYKDGDIVFQILPSGQGKAIQLATHSKYTHCGIVFKEGNQFYVYEAISPVSKTPLKEWIDRGDHDHVLIKRLKDKNRLHPKETEAMKILSKSFLNKDYDLAFNWSDERIYCSELVWKAYKKAGIELCTLKKLKDFDLSSEPVKQKLIERYGKTIPLEEPVVAPSDLIDSKILETVNL